MKKRVVTIENCNVGQILASDILNDQGTIIVLKNTMLNSYIINKLQLWNIKQLYVYETQVSSYNTHLDNKVNNLELKYRYNITQVKDLLCSIAEGGKIDEEKLNNLSDSILMDINETHKIINMLDKVKKTDEYTYTHSMNVSLYSMLIGKWLKFSNPDIKILISAGLLHDIGKTKVPLEILNKTGKLLHEEFEVMKKHSLYGYDIIKNIKSINEDVYTAVLQHHEREDGSGYPSRLKSDQISVFSKIIAISDVYDAVTSDRVYKKRATPFEAFKLFHDECMNSFDYSIVNVFLNNLASFYTGSKVVLNSGNIGEVAFIPPYDICKPVIKIENTFLDLSKEKDIKIACFASF